MFLPWLALKSDFAMVFVDIRFCFIHRVYEYWLLKLLAILSSYFYLIKEFVRAHIHNQTQPFPQEEDYNICHILSSQAPTPEFLLKMHTLYFLPQEGDHVFYLPIHYSDRVFKKEHERGGERQKLQHRYNHSYTQLCRIFFRKPCTGPPIPAPTASAKYFTCKLEPNHIQMITIGCFVTNNCKKTKKGKSPNKKYDEFYKRKVLLLRHV